MVSASGAEADSDHPQSSQPKTVRVVIKGRVQGVFFRDWTTENARQLGLKGWVRNKRDGSVEALFAGEPDKVKEMEQRCLAGPPSAMVTRLTFSLVMKILALGLNGNQLFDQLNDLWSELDHPHGSLISF